MAVNDAGIRTPGRCTDPVFDESNQAGCGHFRYPILPANLPLACLNVPGSQQKIPDSISQGISAKTPGNVRSFEACKQSIKRPIHKFPVIFPDKREFGRGDGFESDCVRHHTAVRVCSHADCPPMKPAKSARPKSWPTFRFGSPLQTNLSE